MPEVAAFEAFEGRANFLTVRPVSRASHHNGTWKKEW
jgi:hypothetical protein